MKIPKILVDGHVLDGRPQGTTTYIAGLYKAIAENNLAKVTIASFNKESLEKYNLTHPNIKWVKLPTKNKYFRLLFSLPYLEYRIRPDFSHYNYVGPIIKFSKRIITCHDLLFLDFPEYFSRTYRVKNKILFYISALNADIISTVSKYSANAISKHFLIPFNEIMIAPNAINTEECSHDDQNFKYKNYFVYVSRFEPRKNQHSLIQAFNQFCDKHNEEFKLILVGYNDLPYTSLEKELVKSKNNRIKILSDLKKTDLIKLYKNSIASIYPSNAEGFGIPPIEAIAAGGVSYCSNNTALSEISDYVNGTFDSNNVDEIEQTLHKAIDMANSDTQYNLRNKVLENFNWKKTAEIFMSYL